MVMPQLQSLQHWPKVKVKAMVMWRLSHGRQPDSCAEIPRSPPPPPKSINTDITCFSSLPKATMALRRQQNAPMARTNSVVNERRYTACTETGSKCYMRRTWALTMEAKREVESLCTVDQCERNVVRPDDTARAWATSRDTHAMIDSGSLSSSPLIKIRIHPTLQTPKFLHHNTTIDGMAAPRSI